MVILLPVPTLIAKKLNKVQKEKMKAVSILPDLVIGKLLMHCAQTDARVQNVTEG